MTVRNAERAAIGGAGASSGPRARLAGWRGMRSRRGVPDWRDWRRWLPTAVLAAGTVAGIVLFFAPLGHVTAALGRMNGLGLISIMPAAALAGIALLALTFVAGLGLSRAKPLLLGATLVAIVVCLDGVTSVAEPQPRFPTAYWIAGFVDTGARSVWPRRT